MPNFTRDYSALKISVLFGAFPFIISQNCHTLFDFRPLIYHLTDFQIATAFSSLTYVTFLFLGNYANCKRKNINFLEIWNFFAIIMAICTFASFFLLLGAWHSKAQIEQEEAQQKIEFREREKRKAEESAQNAQNIIVTEDGSKILKAVYQLGIDKENTTDYLFIARSDAQGYFNIWDKQPCEDAWNPLFPAASREARSDAQDAVVRLLQDGLIERIEKPEWSAEEGVWYRLTSLGLAEAKRKINEEERPNVCEPSPLTGSDDVPLDPATGLPVPSRPSIILEGIEKILRKLHANGVDDDGEYRFFVRGQDGAFEIGTINYFQNRKIETIAQDRPDQDFPLNAKLAVDQMLRENIIERTASPSWSHNDGVTWYKVTSYGLSQMRDSVKPPTSPPPALVTDENSPSLPPNARPAAMQISPDSQAPPKEQEVETVPVPLGPAIPQETVPTPPAKPSV